MTDLCSLSATELLERYRKLELSPVAVTKACLRRIAVLDPTYHAFITVTADRALEQARAAEAQYQEAKGNADRLPPLLGVPFTLKDLVPTKGIRTTFGSLLHKDNVPDFDSPLVDRLYRAGAVLLGKTNTPEFGYKGDTANRLLPPCVNPWTGTSPGGSSGGAAVSVATGMAPLAHGTDGAGSIRIPASMCGVVGFKPSRGLIPLYPSASPLSHAGPLTRTVRDAAIMTDVMGGYHRLDPTSWEPNDPCLPLVDSGRTLKGCRVACLVDHRDVLGPGVLEGLLRAREVLVRLGCTVTDVSLHDRLTSLAPDLVFPPFPTISKLWQMHHSLLHPDLDAVENLLEPIRVKLMRLSQKQTAIDYGTNLRRKDQYYFATERLMDDLAFDVILSPSLTITANDWPLGAEMPLTDQQYNRYLSLFNLTGQPACSVPVSLDPFGAPLGVQIAARFRQDATVLWVCHELEKMLLWPGLRLESKQSKL